MRHALRIAGLGALLAGCSATPKHERIVAEKYPSNGWTIGALVSVDRHVCHVKKASMVLAAEVGKPFACAWEKP